jgi:H2-forming N5,N10-methylenetetrahydromethanopterin dehydrogenase-like enzyme
VGGHTLKQMGKSLALADGTTVKVDAKAKTIAGVKVVSADQKATNGEIQVLAGPLPKAR